MIQSRGIIVPTSRHLRALDKMKLDELEEIVACLPKERTLFNYAKDWYAVQLLKYSLEQPQAVHRIKQSNFGKLLNKPQLRSWLGSLGSTTLSREQLAMLYPEKAEAFRLTLDRFDWVQTSRKGKESWNLVLQLNLNNADACYLEKYLPERDVDPFELRYHPIHEGRNRTLAWARIDLDLNREEALIEEIQNDRIRETLWWLNYIREGKRKFIRCGQKKLPAQFIEQYWERHMKAHSKMWDEAMLCAAIFFIREELGIRDIFYHTPESGSRYKGDGASGAPRSIYSKLPERFCFKKTDEVPSFLMRRRKTRPKKNTQQACQFHLLQL